MRLGQILLNFTANAVKFTERGSVSIRTRVTEDYPEEVVLRFEVQDTGIGITIEGQKHLFTAFEQADSSTTRRFGGTGLGLAISKRLVGLMQGHIGAISRPGAGSTFWVELERAAAQAGWRSAPRAGRNRRRTHRRPVR